MMAAGARPRRPGRGLCHLMLLLLAGLAGACQPDLPASKDAGASAPRPARRAKAPVPRQAAADTALAALSEPSPEAEQTASGLAYQILTPGVPGPSPGPADRVRVAYQGWTPDGRVFDRVTRLGPARTFRMKQLIPGWQEALGRMTVGARWRLWLPGQLAYDQARRGSTAPPGPVTFDLELLEIHRPFQNGLASARPPRDATTTPSGLAYLLLKHRPGRRPPQEPRPAPGRRLLVHFTGWTADGQEFDGTRRGGPPRAFNFAAVIPGWREGLPRLREGERALFWVPSRLAYGDRATGPHYPAGPLVYDVELLAIE